MQTHRRNLLISRQQLGVLTRAARWRAGRRRWTIVRLLVAGVFLCVGGCAQDPLEGPDNSDTDGTEVLGVGELPPIDSRLEELFGYSIADLQLAVERARVQIMGICLVEQGWEFEFHVPEPFDPTNAERRTAGENAKEFIAESLADPTADDDRPDAYYRDFEACQDRASSTIRDPVTEAWEWLASETSGLYERVATAPEVVAASGELTECLRRSGYSWTPETGLDVDFYTGSQEVVEAFNAGSLTLDEASAALDELSRQERQVWSATDPCVEAYLATEGRIAVKLERIWLDSEGSRLALMVQELKETIVSLESELLAIAEQRG